MYCTVSFNDMFRLYVVGQLSSRTHHRVLTVAALDKSLSMVWWRWHTAFHSCVVGLWHSLSEWRVLVCRRKNVGAWIESKFSKTFWRGKITFWAVSSRVMKHGSTNTTLKRSCKLHKGRLPIPHNQKHSVGPNHESKQCCWPFFIC